MLNINIIPAIDIIDGRCVRLTKGDYASEKVYSDNPVDVAKRFESAGASRLHLVDLDGAKSSSPRNLDVLERIASGTGMTVEFGGGIKSEASLKSAIDAGASKIVCGSLAVTDSDIVKDWLIRYPGRIILGIDVKDGLVAIKGWTAKSALSAGDLIRTYGNLAGDVEITEISHDGTLQGVDAGMYSEIQTAFPGITVIASGGVSCLQDIEKLEQSGIRAVIVGKAIYEGKINLEEIF